MRIIEVKYFYVMERVLSNTCIIDKRVASQRVRVCLFNVDSTLTIDVEIMLKIYLSRGM